MKPCSVAVIGAGLMGVGIAARFAQHGHPTHLFDVDAARLAQAPAVLASILDELIEVGQFASGARADALRALVPCSDLAQIGDARLVIEAAPENLALKHGIYRELEAIVADDVIIGSNTSGYTPDALTPHVRAPQRFLVTHFWNTPHTVPLVEIVPGSATAAELPPRVAEMLTAVGASPVILNKAIPGFIGNRLQFAVLREALAIVQSGAATPEVVDTVMKASLGRRYGLMGPFEVADLAGLDTILSIAEHLMPELAHDQRSLDLLRERVGAGQTGIRSGVGFYQWNEARRARSKAIRARQLRGTTLPEGQ